MKRKELKAIRQEAYNHGYQDGYSDGYEIGRADGYDAGCVVGYKWCLNDVLAHLDDLSSHDAACTGEVNMSEKMRGTKC